jgi:hypothetical protein
MLAWFRAGVTAALLVFAPAPAQAADKAFQDDTLDDAAIMKQFAVSDGRGQAFR